jgi:tripartite motif-containing protein 71
MLIANLPFKIVVTAAIGALLTGSIIISSVYAQNVVKRWSVKDPVGIYLDSKDNVYVVQASLNRISEFASNGTLIRSWGSSGTGPGQFNNPIGITIDRVHGNVYVTDTGNNRVQEFTSGGKFIRSWGSSGTGPGQFQTPVGIDEDETRQNVFVADVGNHRIQRFTGNGLFVSEFGSYGSGEGQFYNARRVAIGSLGHNLFVADFGNNRIQKFDGETGKFIMQWGSLGSGDAQFSNPTGMAVQYLGPGRLGDVYVADIGNSRIQEFTIDGKFVKKLAIDTPMGSIDYVDLDVDAKGFIYLTDRASNQVEVISPK